VIKYSGWEYLLIDLANNFGLDKLLFPERIQWAQDNLHQLEELTDQADSKTKPLYMKTVLAIRKVLRGEPTGHLVGMDAVCSGIQIMSALTGCVKGATATGLVDPNVRADAYTQLTGDMCTLLGTTQGVIRDDAKDALMTSFYGSKAKPKEIFDEDTPELNAFYEAAQAMAPGAWELLQDLLASWRPFALKHSWKLPDGFDAVVKVMQPKQARVEVDELDHATFTYEFYVNEGSKTGLSNVANVVHSVDGYILRCIHRRCNYDRAQVEYSLSVIDSEINLRAQNMGHQSIKPAEGKLAYYIEQYNRSGMADIVILSHIKDGYDTMYLSVDHLEKLNTIILSMLVHQPFPVVTIHDEFKCGANHMNHLRQHYINIFAELAESNLLSDLLSQVHGTPGVFPKLSTNLGSLIRGSNYALS
jgi:hypothetical protein